MSKTPESKPLKVDGSAKSTSPDLPAFLSRPEGAPVYHGFSIVPETMTDGWCLGAITEYADPKGCEWGDAFVVAPDGSRAGLVWQVGKGELSELLKPDQNRWGVYSIWFSKPIRTTNDLVGCFREVLPQLQEIYSRVRHSAT